MARRIPRITADLISAVAAISQLRAEEALRQRCHVVQAIAARGTPVDSLTVGELLQLANASKQFNNLPREIPA
ncbi:MAG: hypothetical protein ACREPD_06190 [Stenotrophomonas sp.]|uniref:hypothetical protein n=1 Tax=Stenotrophomonas sp. TaxID=69392 RepID=UPI003D6D99A3